MNWNCTDGQVDSQCASLHCQCPDVQTVHGLNASKVLQIGPQLAVVNIARNTLHKYMDGVADQAECRGQHQDGKEESADRVGQFIVGLYTNKISFLTFKYFFLN